ncbi:MAG: hypothetical protein EXQ89_08285 [Rhodospirillaceae bacterium]|nr:hypothetical protein [Rhodospirillaceae bacterium]
MGDSPSPLAGDFAAAIEVAPPEARAAAAQDALDVLAVAAGIKPFAAVGWGIESAAFRVAIAAAARRAGLAAFDGPPWIGESGISGRRWYDQALREDAAATRILLVGSPGSEAALRRLAGSRLGAGEEAGVLGYPQCCVKEFHRRQRLFHLITRRMIGRQAQGDETLLGRLTRARVMLAPKTETELKLLLRATRMVFAPFTSIAMCRACEADSGSAARLISARFESLPGDVAAALRRAG